MALDPRLLREALNLLEPSDPAVKPAVEAERARVCAEVERYFAPLKTMEPPVMVTDLTDTKIWWQGLKDGLTSEEIATCLHRMGY